MYNVILPTINLGLISFGLWVFSLIGKALGIPSWLNFAIGFPLSVALTTGVIWIWTKAARRNGNR